ncbi:MAG: DUF4105 domain-containing protein, partial [Pseudomonadota bacterium]
MIRALVALSINTLTRLLLLSIFLLPYTVQADTSREQFIESLLAEAEDASLAQNPEWLKLLHYTQANTGGGESEIVSPEFFLDPAGHSDPELELEATLRAFYKPIPDDPNQHARCRFPARLHWLQTKLSFAAQAMPYAECPDLLRWARFRHLQSISVISVSGFFGNPASAFGHLLIKLNNSPNQAAENLLDTGVNFGAAIPDDENILLYIGRGLFGGYRASFSDRKFYAQYNVYADSEARDMWEYELNLTHTQQRFLIFHLWELVGQEYVYYFLRENCGQRMAEVLELALNIDLDSRSGGWYLPITLFHRLHDIDARAPGSLIRKIRYIPARERRFERVYESLTESQKNAFSRVVKRIDEEGQTTELNLLTLHSPRLRDAVDAYFRYRLATIRYAKSGESERQRLKQVLESLNADSSASADAASQGLVPDAPPPAAGSKPSRVRLGAVRFDNDISATSLRYSPAYYELLGNNNFDHAELIVMDFEFYDSEDSGLDLHNLDLISIQELANDNTGYLNSGGVSWRAYAGINRNTTTCDDCYQLEL